MHGSQLKTDPTTRREILMFKHRALVALPVVVASYVPAAPALALSGTNHNDTLLLAA